MNERIRELAEQAGIAVWGDAVYMYHPEDTLDSTVMEKFAQLIVKECLNELCEQMDKHNVDLSNLPSWYKALAKTEEHLGVK